MKKYFLIGLLSVSLCSLAQESLPLAVQQKNELDQNSWVKNVPFERIYTPEIGNQINHFDIRKDNPLEWMVAPASGGLWLSKDAGITYENIFQNQPTQQIKTFAVHWGKGIIWVATPYGLFTSKDKGNSWFFGGLPEFKTIESVHINPRNTDEVVVAVLGNPFDADEKRGVFKTSDEGKTWQHSLFVGNRAGVSQIIDIPNGQTLFASVWHDESTTWKSIPYGSMSAVYKSEDFGTSWSKVSTDGFLSGNFIGKIGLAAHGDEKVYAVVDNRGSKTRSVATRNLAKITNIHLLERDFEAMNKTDFLNLDDNKLNAFLHAIGQDKKYTAQNLKDMISAEITSPARLMIFLGIRQQEVIGAEVYVTSDGGKTWQKTHSQPLEDVFYQNGNQFGAITVDPNNDKHLFIGAYPLLESLDGGKSWQSKHNVSLDDSFEKIYYRNNTLYATSKKGLAISYTQGKDWIFRNVPQSVSFTKIGYDKHQKSLFLASEQGVFMSKNNIWTKISSQRQLFGSENDIYVGSGNGIFYRYNVEKNTFLRLKSLYTSENKAPLRFGKQTPLLVSQHNSDVLYVGSNKMRFSSDRGQNWRTISEDLTIGSKKGNDIYATISAIAESPLSVGLLYVGSDDGTIHITSNGGTTWQSMYASNSNAFKVNNLVASKHHQKRVFATFSHPDKTNPEPLIFMSEDQGVTWTELRSNLPDGRINIVKEDPKNEQIIYLGTDSGLYVSFNLGESWHSFGSLPATGILDIFINDGTSEILVSTAGYGVFKSSLEVIQPLRVAIVAQDFFPLREKVRVEHSNRWGNTWSDWESAELPITHFEVFASKEMKLQIKIMKGKVTLQSFTYKTSKGFNYIPYDMTISSVGKVMFERVAKRISLETASDGRVYLPKGEYTIVFSVEGGFDEERILEIY
ncbi:WD40/YVTN/BNR-like repeat-containing protein [Capnocytophaga canis]|uniref:WD40/YVTN/BNR-like repeat-containing protein n=1 Tax=Capnocytophaga canis TaxID=1848903 RepID=UPI00370D7247